MRLLKFIALLLVLIGAINWGLWGFFQFDLVAYLFDGNTTMGARVVYSIIGLAGVLGLGCLGRFKSCCCRCHCHDEEGKGKCCSKCGCCK